MSHEIRIKRVYEGTKRGDGYRILVDRLWPRGVSKEKADLDDWNKDIAPSPELREWFGHKPDRFEEFSKRYKVELDQNQAAFDFVKQAEKQLKKSNVTLLYGAKDHHINHAIVLQDWLSAKESDPSGSRKLA